MTFFDRTFYFPIAELEDEVARLRKQVHQREAEARLYKARLEAERARRVEATKTLWARIVEIRDERDELRDLLADRRKAERDFDTMSYGGPV